MLYGEDYIAFSIVHMLQLYWADTEYRWFIKGGLYSILNSSYVTIILSRHRVQMLYEEDYSILNSSYVTIILGRHRVQMLYGED